MSSDTRMPLSSVAEIVSVKVPVSSLGGHPYVSTENLLPNLGGLGEGALPDADRVNSFNKHDTLFSNIRPYFRKVHYAPTGGGCSADVLVFRTKDPQEFWPPYLYYCLADPTFIEHTMATCKGAKMPRGDKGAMLQYLVPKPDLDAQKRVSSLLRSLDESITALQQQNTALESIAQRLFRSWFVNFDPVHAKAAGKEPEAMSAELAALFPSEFEDSELGPIPKGWKVGYLSDLGNIVCGKTPPTADSDNYGNDVPFVTIPDMHGKLVITSTVRSLSLKGANTQAKKYLPSGSICVSCIATPGLVVQVTEPSQTNQQINSLVPDAKWGRSFPLFLLRQVGDKVRAGGSGGTVFHNLSKSGFEKIKLVIPDYSAAHGFCLIADKLVENIINNERMCNLLGAVRDHLLPRLISGKLSLEEAQQVVEEATAA